MDPAYCGDTKAPVSSDDVLPISLRKVIGRRALMELAPDDVLNVGTGIPNDVVGPIITEEGMSEDVTITVESGIYGGIPMGGIDFGIARNQFALVRHDDQFDYYNGPGVDVTYMGAGEVDAEGNVNATRLGPKPTGAGGFIDITTVSYTHLDVYKRQHDIRVNETDIICIEHTAYSNQAAADKGGQHLIFERIDSDCIGRVLILPHCL